MSLPFHSSLPELRLKVANQADPDPARDFVLYWMTSQRRPTYNFGLQRAVEWAQQLGRPLLIFEALRYDYPWACPRFHGFVIQGMQAHRDYFATRPVSYFPYVEPSLGHAQGLLEGLADRACVVVGDWFPCFFLPRMQSAVARRLPVRVEWVDGNGLLPLAAAPKAYERAVDFRRYLQKSLAPHLSQTPLPDPLAGLELPRLENPPPSWKGRQGMDMPAGLSGPAEVKEQGGFRQADACLQRFFSQRLELYHLRSDPSQAVASELSPYLHFGHISVHQVLHQIAKLEDWTPAQMRYRPTGSKEGSWGLNGNTESFLDELVTWRELGYNFCHYRQDYDRYESLPAWARHTLEEHLGDARPYLYDLTHLLQAETHDPLWNAAQRQLNREGRMHNYLRMLWGKKILEWSEHPRQALEVMIELNNRLALDGRNPNSYSGIFWCLGRYDRPWFERPIFGTIRYMSSEATARKFKLQSYLERNS